MQVGERHRQQTTAAAFYTRVGRLPAFGPPSALDRRNFELDQKQKAKDEKARIRCPICRWQPPRSSRWYCLPMGAPENFAGGCGHRWNTFDTRGLCPGCSYQWKHTSCLRCGSTSVHEDWYEKGRDDDAPRSI